MVLFLLSGVTFAATITTPTQLQSALDSAKAGDVIILKAGTTFSGNFKSTKSGSSSSHIIIKSESSSNPAILKGSSTGSGYGLNIIGSYWEIRDLKVTNSQKGIMVEKSTGTLVYNCEVYNVGQEGIHLRNGSSNNTIQNSNVHNTGKTDAGYGEGIYVGSDKGKWGTYNAKCDNNTIKGCKLGPNITAEHVDIKEGTTGTIVDSCTFDGKGISGANSADSFIDVKGNKAVIKNNNGDYDGNSKMVAAFQVHQQVSGWGLNESFTGNTVKLGSGMWVVDAASGTSATASNNTRTPANASHMYNGNVN